MEELTPRQNKVSRLIQKDLAEMFQNYARSPELNFFIDDSLDYLENIEKLLKQ